MNKNNRMSKRLLNYVIVLLVCLISSAESFAQGTKFQVKGSFERTDCWCYNQSERYFARSYNQY